jgi:hypothetical protein
MLGAINGPGIDISQGLSLAVSGNQGDTVTAGIFQSLGGGKGKRLHSSRKRKPVTLASGKLVFHRAGTQKLKIKLTAAGKRALRKTKKLKVTVRMTYTPAGGKPVTTTKATTLKQKRPKKRSHRR